MVEDKPLTALVKRTFLKLPDEGFISREADALTPNILNFQETSKAQETGTMPTAGD